MVDECGHDHTEERREAYKRSAEAVVSASSADRATLNERVALTLKDAKEAWPNVADDDLLGFFQSQAMLIDRLSRMDVMTLAPILDAIFTNCTLAAASLAGAYDLGDVETPKRDVEELFTEAKAAAAERAKDLNANTGMFL